MSKPRRTARIVAVLALLGASTGGCAGAGAKITATTSAFPLSLSAALPDGQGRVLVLDRELQRVGQFEASKTQIGIFYGAMSGVFDISAAVNERVRAAGGEGIVQLAITSSNCALNWFFPLTILPFWPGCQTVHVRGTIVKRRATPRAAHAGALGKRQARDAR